MSSYTLVLGSTSNTSTSTAAAIIRIIPILLLHTTLITKQASTSHYAGLVSYHGQPEQQRTALHPSAAKAACLGYGQCRHLQAALHATVQAADARHGACRRAARLRCWRRRPSLATSTAVRPTALLLHCSSSLSRLCLTSHVTQVMRFARPRSVFLQRWASCR